MPEAVELDQLVEGDTTLPTSLGAGEPSIKTILVLDDDPSSLNVLTWVLERQYRILRTDTVEEAIRLCQDHHERISLIVADVVLHSPVSGTQVAVEIRRSCLNVPILLTSGTPLEGWQEQDFGDLRSMMGTPVDFLQKPFAAQQLLHKVENLLSAPAAPAKMQTLFEEAQKYRAGRV